MKARSAMEVAAWILVASHLAWSQSVDRRNKSEAVGTWPVIQHVRRVIKVTNAPTAKVDLAFPDVGGRVVYRLACRGSDVEDDQHAFPGDFGCYLFAGYGPSPRGNLLANFVYAETPSENGARFFASDGRGACSGPMNCGFDRVFRLRGMKLRIALRDPTLAEGQLGLHLHSFQLVIDASPDEHVISALDPRARLDQCWIGGRPRPRRTEVASAAGPFAIPVQAWRFEFPGRPSQYMWFGRRMPAGMVEHSAAIKDTTGVERFTLQCSGFVAMHGMPARCGVFAVGEDENLIGTFDPLTLFPRSDIAVAQIVGPCKNYPNWGRNREFRLRGMKISIDVTDVAVSADPLTLIDRFALQVTVRSDPAASCRVAERPREGDWRSDLLDDSCATVRPVPPDFEGCPRDYLAN